MILEVRHLRLVFAIAKEGGVTKASQVLHLTQSALSHQLREIESILGTQLFIRQRKKMILTQPGKKLLLVAETVLPQLQQAEDVIRRLARGEDGVLRISTQCNTFYHWLPSMMKSFSQLFPGVEIQIVFEATNRPLEALLEGQIDLAITYARPADKELACVPIFEDEFLTLMRPDHPMALRPFLRPADFQDQPLILYTTPLDHNYFYRNFLQPAKVLPGKIYHVMLTEAILEMVEAGLGISVMARWAAWPYLKSGKLRGVPISRRGMRRQLYAVTIKSASTPPYLDSFARLLADGAFPAIFDKQTVAV